MLGSLSLVNFRSHLDLQLGLSPSVTLIIGQNGSGKSSVIEALNLLATGQSFRASKIEEMVAFDQELARVVGNVVLEQAQHDVAEHDAVQHDITQAEKLEIILTRGFLQGKKVQKKYTELNGARRRARDLRGLLYTVVFRPEDLRLVEGSPSRRRSFLDEVIAPLDLDYAQSLSTYEKTLVRRNKLLLAVREGKQPQTVLHYWNLGLIKHGQVLQALRKEFLKFCPTIGFPVKFWVEYVPNLIDELRLQQHESREIAAGHTLIGPHKDDFVISGDVQNIERGKKENFYNMALYGSRGQQRLAVLWLKTCQLFYILKKTQNKPMLLLDDILSELDTKARSFALSLMVSTQSLITTASLGIAQRIEKTFPDCKKITLS